MDKEDQKYILDQSTLSEIWKCLYESGHEGQAALLAKKMIEQGCQELPNTNDMNLILAFWRDYLEENNLIKFESNLH